MKPFPLSKPSRNSVAMPPACTSVFVDADCVMLRQVRGTREAYPIELVAWRPPATTAASAPEAESVASGTQAEYA